MSGWQLNFSGKTFKGSNSKIVLYDKNGKIEFVAKLYHGLCVMYSRSKKLETRVTETND